MISMLARCFLALGVAITVPSNASASDEALLVLARYFQSDPSGSCEACVTLNGVVEVKNIAFDKEVSVVHSQSFGDSWRTVSASYLGPSREGYEYWEFSSSFFDFDPVTLAISYTVDGQTYWDNNGGQDYEIVRQEPLIAAPSIQHTLTKNEALRIRSFPTYIVYENSVHLRNLAFDKVVTVLYTTDDWDTEEEVQASYQGTEDNGLERWGFSIVAPSETEAIDFAISYEVDGQTYWDNNFGRDYNMVNY